MDFREITNEESEFISQFTNIARKIISTSLPLTGNIDCCKFNTILTECNINTVNFNKDVVYQTLWYQYLVLIKEYMKEYNYKYDITLFKKTYNPELTHHRQEGYYNYNYNYYYYYNHYYYYNYNYYCNHYYNYYYYYNYNYYYYYNYYYNY